MDESRLRAEQLLTLSSAARRLSDLVAAAEQPLRYEVVRHLLDLQPGLPILMMSGYADHDVSARVAPAG